MLEEKHYLVFGNMSRIGKQKIEIPTKTEVIVGDGIVTVKGPGGELTRSFRPDVEIKVEGNIVVVNTTRDTILSRALWGTYASHIINMIQGVNEPYVKKLVIEGVGYKGEVSGSDVVLNVGFSHQVKLSIPDNITATIEKNVITISGIDKETVGQFAAEIRSKKKPEPYKGKGIRYEDEVVRRKQGKRAVA